MALLSCNECRNPCSTDAKCCPHCGAKAPKEEQSQVSKVFSFLGLIFFGFVIYSCSTAPEHVDTPVEKAEKIINNVIYTCSFSVENLLNDPKSAKFIYESANVKIITKPKPAWLVTIPVRAKNSFNATVLNIFQCKVVATGVNQFKTVNVFTVQ
jgi:hypothetical protein